MTVIDLSVLDLPVYLLRITNDNDSSSRRRKPVENAIDAAEELLESVNHASAGDELLCCSHCSHSISNALEAFRLNNETGRVFTNPAGVSFHVSYFGVCPGALIFGPYTTEASWFDGTHWAYAICANCHQHLGWHYRYPEGGEPFFGIISSKLVNASSLNL